MEPDIAQHKAAIAELCRGLGVKSLLAFAPAAFADSLAFLVQFKPMPSALYATCYFSLAAKLEELLRAPVELVELEAGDNPYFTEAVGASQVSVHELSPR
jgi:hypothetical protein